jgi:ABC-type nitrate/sulfonate/bicarbonate transport system permease component
VTLATNKWFIRVVAFIVVLGGWQVAGMLSNPLLFSTPVGIVLGAGTLLSGTGSYSLSGATSVTLQEMIIGFVIAIGVGIPLGLVVGMRRVLDKALTPYINALYVTPRIALIPLIVIWFGVGLGAIIFVVFLGSLFPVLINTYAGVKNASRSFVDTAEVFEVKGLQRFRKVLFPATLPFVMTGLRIGLAEAFINVIVAQMVLSLTGLGYMLLSYGNYFDTPQMLGILIELMAIGAAITGFVQYLERRLSHWKLTERAFR